MCVCVVGKWRRRKTILYLDAINAKRTTLVFFSLFDVRIVYHCWWDMLALMQAALRRCCHISHEKCEWLACFKMDASYKMMLKFVMCFAKTKNCRCLISTIMTMYLMWKLYSKFVLNKNYINLGRRKVKQINKSVGLKCCIVIQLAVDLE